MIILQKSRSDLPEVNKQLIKKAVENTLTNFNKSNADVTVRLTDDTEISQLNQEYRNISSATDVLAFNQDFQDPETKRLYLGDIVISMETVVEQAPKYNLTLDQECAFLAIHGTLHLLGYDHGTPEGKATMWEIQDKMLKETIRDYQEKADR